jgi:hypothetical protein
LEVDDVGGYMDFKRISDLSFFNDDQKQWFKNYIIYENGDVFNEKTGKSVARTMHGSRGFVVNLSMHVDGIRRQRQVALHRAIADLFIRPIKEGEKLFFIDSDKKNISVGNLIYRLTEKQKKAEYGKCLVEMKGISDSGRFCNSCGNFKSWDEMAGKNNNKSSTCRQCASKRGSEYQKSVDYSKRPVNFDTYSSALKDDSPINKDGLLGFVCSKCKKEFLLQRSKVLSRVRSIKLTYNVKPLVCEECVTGGKNV